MTDNQKICSECGVDMSDWDDDALIYEMVESSLLGILYWTTEPHDYRHVKWLCGDCESPL